MRPWILVTAVLAGCGTPWIEEIDGDLRRLTSTLKSNGAGTLKATIRPEVGESAMLVTIEPIEPNIDCHVRTLQVGTEVPYRADVEVGLATARSQAAFISHVGNLNWPITADDGFLRPGINHKVQIGLVAGTTYTPGVARVSVVLKRDIDFAAGTLRVNVVYGGSTGSDPDVVLATEEAVALWRNIYEDIGIELEITYFDFLPGGVVGPPGQSDLETWEEISGSVPFPAVNLVILEEIDTTGITEFALLGFAGDIPGPLVSTGTSAVAVDATAAAGTDGQFSARDVQILAETMAHETGHYLGLFHVVEDTWDSWDALADTADCTNQTSCVQTLGGNLMFPFPVCDSVSCVPQTELSPQQGAVANRYTGVL